MHPSSVLLGLVASYLIYADVRLPIPMPRNNDIQATKGRKMLVAWVGNGTYASQSLPRDISLSPADGSLRQAWVPELQKMRVAGSYTASPSSVAGGLQLELLASFSFESGSGGGGGGGSGGESSRSSSRARRFGVQVLQTADGAEGTQVGVDLDAGIVFIDGRRSKSCEAMPWLCPYQPGPPLHVPSPRRNGLYLYVVPCVGVAAAAAAVVVVLFLGMKIVKIP